MENEEFQMECIVKGRPEGFYETFDRKAGKDKITTHYCPGCGHGRVHKVVAEALSEMGLADRAIFISPVGCSVFAYYYMNTGNVQAPHGRAPAVGTGLSRARPESIVISYQGDGDLAAIGTNEIIHAANRGENMTVLFINNAIYGMTGGQLAPTSIPGQKTLTTPRGRNPINDGYPLRMSEIIATLEAPVYVERVSCTDIKGIMKMKKAIRKGLQLQAERKGFSFIEILSVCPTNWKMTPQEGVKWIQETLEKYFVPGVYKDITEKAESRPLIEEVTDPEEIFKILGLEKGKTPVAASTKKIGEKRVKIAGFGGQGALTAGAVLATAGMNDGLQVSWQPSYGPEMRGGTANCSVILSDRRIGSPLFKNPSVLVALNRPSLDAFETTVTKDGIIIVNSSIVDRKVERQDVRALYVPLTEIAAELGLKAMANSVAIGAYLALDPVVERDRIYEVFRTSFKKKSAADLNIAAVDRGYEFVKKL